MNLIFKEGKVSIQEIVAYDYVADKHNRMPVDQCRSHNHFDIVLLYQEPFVVRNDDLSEINSLSFAKT